MNWKRAFVTQGILGVVMVGGLLHRIDQWRTIAINAVHQLEFQEKVLQACFDGWAQDRMQQQKLSDYAPTTGRLSVSYREINEDYFYGALPAKKTTVTLGDLTDQEELGHITQRPDGTWLIVVDQKGHHTERQAEMTMIHEMCHQEVKIAGADAGLDGHSKAFEACMVSVAKHGGFKDLW